MVGVSVATIQQGRVYNRIGYKWYTKGAVSKSEANALRSHLAYIA